MGEAKKQAMELEEKLLQRAFNEWEIEKMLTEMTSEEILSLCNKIDEEQARRKKQNEN